MESPPTGVPLFVFWLMPEDDPLYEEWPASALLRAWHRGRCGVCQVTDYFDRDLVMDHDHETGKIRGLLCRGCNSSEPHNTSPAFVAWRAGLNTATVLGIDEAYEPLFGGDPKSAASGYMISDEMLDKIAAAAVDGFD